MPISLSRSYDRLLTLCGFVSGAIICVLAVMITADVVLRNLGVVSLPWLLEVSEYVLFITTFIAAPWVLSLGKHVRVDLLFSAVNAAWARVLEICADLCGLMISLILAWYGLRVTLDSLSLGAWIHKELVVPEAALLMFIPLGCSLMAVEFLRRAWRLYLNEAPQETSDILQDGL